MQTVKRYAAAPEGLGADDVRQAVLETLGGLPRVPRKVLLVPPDHTRMHSMAGPVAEAFRRELPSDCVIDVLPALGTHVAMTRGEWDEMYPGFDHSRMLVHHWRDEVIQIGEIPADFVREISGGLMDSPVPVDVNRHLLDPSYDLILSVGQVVPHEVAGMANHAKNIFVGCGGSGMINASHMLGAVCGMEDIMGRDRTPVRALFDYAAEHFLGSLPLVYALSVTTADAGGVHLHGLFIGDERGAFEEAVRLSQKKNIFHLDKPIQKAIVMLDGDEFKSTWLGNKAIYRTRMAIADGGELIILAPGVSRFGEDAEADRLIRKYGYSGINNILKHVAAQEELRRNLSAAAHLIHGSSDDRFSITYCVRHLKREEVEGVGFRYLPYNQAAAEYAGLAPGANTDASGTEMYYIQNPALGLWTVKGRIA